MANNYGIYDADYRHLRSIRDGAISTSPEKQEFALAGKLGLKKQGNTCSVSPTNNRNSESESYLANLKTVLPWERV